MEKRLNELENTILIVSRATQKLSYALGAKAAVLDIALQILLQQQAPNAEFCMRLREEVTAFLDARNNTFDVEIDSAVANSMNILLQAAGEPPNIGSSEEPKAKEE